VTDLSDKKPYSSYNYDLPWIVFLVGFLISFAMWAIFLFVRYSNHYLVIALQSVLPWFLFVMGILLSFLCSIAIWIIQLSRERTQSLTRIDQDSKKEIAERARTDETKQKLESALLQGQKLQAIGTLAGGIAHDFNNILYAIIGYVEMSRDDVPPDSLIFKNLGKVLDAAKRGQDLVARILAFSRRHIHEEFKPINLKLIIESVLSLLKPAIPSSVIIDLIGISDDYFILGDQTQLHQVMVNIINNAVDAMDGEGQVTIEIKRILTNDAFLKEFPDLKNTNYFQIDISDTGHGMDKSTIARIFEPFFTTKEVGKGTGLGLSTVHAIIQEHLGAITVKSQLGTGTTFSILLPETHTIQQEEKHGNDLISGR